MTDKRIRILKGSFLFLGLGSLIWFLVRVIPKPSRAAYPCMRVAAPVASTFVLWLLGLGSSLMFLKRAHFHLLRSRYLVAFACIAAAAITGITIISTHHSSAFATLKTASPIGEAKGANPGRVVWVHDSNATNWAGLGDGHWWENSHTNQAVVDQMMSNALRALSGMPGDAAAWDTLFRYYNASHGRGSIGYSAGEKIAIKINLAFCSFVPSWCSVDSITYTLARQIDYMYSSPQVVRALLRQLVNVVGVNQADISIGDPQAYYPSELYDSCHTEFPDVHYIDHAGNFGRTKAEYSTVPFYWSCRPAGVTQDYVPRFFAEATYLINLANMKAHSGAGITICAKNHFGSLIRTPFDSGYYNMHGSLPYLDSLTGRYRALVDLMGHAHLGGKTVLYLVDGLYAGTHPADSLPHKWSTTPFNGDWTSSLFASQDPVAIESFFFDLFQLDDDTRQYPKLSGVEDYLIEAARADNPPSGTFYDPNHAGDSVRLQSLGTFEHWNDSINRQYSRNLHTGNGIELVFIDGTTSGIRPSGYSGGAVKSAYSLRALPLSGSVELFLPRSGEVKLLFFDCRGKLLGTALDGFMGSGSYRVELSRPSGKLRPLPDGMYIAALYCRKGSTTQPVASCTVTMAGR